MGKGMIKLWPLKFTVSATLLILHFFCKLPNKVCWPVLLSRNPECHFPQMRFSLTRPRVCAGRVFVWRTPSRCPTRRGSTLPTKLTFQRQRFQLQHTCVIWADVTTSQEMRVQAGLDNYWCSHFFRNQNWPQTNWNSFFHISFKQCNQIWWKCNLCW